MSATCQACDERHPYGLLCPLHAEAEAMRDVLAAIQPVIGGWREAIALIEDYGPKDESVGKNMWAALNQIDAFRAAARPILARIEGKAE